MHGGPVSWESESTASPCTMDQYSWTVGRSGHLTVVLRCIVCRWGTVDAAAKVGFKRWACYRNEHSARRNSTVRDIPIHGNVSCFFRHADGGHKDLKTEVKETKGVGEGTVVQEAGSER